MFNLFKLPGFWLISSLSIAAGLTLAGDLVMKAPMNLPRSASPPPSVVAVNVSLVGTLKGHAGEVNAVAFSPNGRFLASGSKDRTIKLWNISNRTAIRSLKGHTDGVWAVAFSPDNKILASSSKDRTIKLWNVANGSLIRTLKGHGGEVNDLAFNSNGKTLASASDDSTIRLWNPSTGQLARTLRAGQEVGSIVSLAFASDGGLYSGSIIQGAGAVSIWDTQTGESNHIEMPPIFSVAVSRDGRFLVAGGAGSTVAVVTDQGMSRSTGNSLIAWDLQSGEARTLDQSEPARIFEVAINPDGRTLAAARDDGRVELWNLATGQKIQTLTGHTALVYSLAFSADGRFLATASDDRTIKLWRIQ